MKKILTLLVTLACSSCIGGEVETINMISDSDITTIKNMDIKESRENTKKIIEKKDTCLAFDDFTNPDKNNWIIVNDGVMGGKSFGEINIQDNIFYFSGIINTNGGGFSSVRTSLPSSILSTYNNIKIRAKPDSREYQITFRDSNIGRISHRAILPFRGIGDVEEIVIDIKTLEPVSFGRRVDAASFQKENAKEIGFILNDGKDGDFKLEIESIEFCI